MSRRCPTTVARQTKKKPVKKLVDKFPDGFKIKSVRLATHLSTKGEPDYVDFKIQDSPGFPLQRGLP
jgi:hypothetical protein